MDKEQKELLQKALGDKLVSTIADTMDNEGVIARSFVTGLGMDSGELSRFFNRKNKLSLEKVLLMIDYLGYEVKLEKKGEQ